jgi:FkbH-like protein
MSVVSKASGADCADLESALERYLGSEESRDEQFAELCTGVSKLIQANQFAEAGTILGRLTSVNLDYTSMQSLVRLFHRCRGRCGTAAQKTRLAVLSSFTTQQLIQMVELFLFAAGAAVELYEADYGVFRQEIIDPGAGLYSFKPNNVLIATTWRDLTHWPGIGDDVAKAAECVAAEQREWSLLWQTAHERQGCQIIQNNFDMPSWRQLGNHEMRHPASMGRFITEINRSFQNSAPPFVTIQDVENLSSLLGRRLWGDERFFHHAKLPCAPECLVAYAHSLASLLIAQLGLSKKCLVLDLDNTLWGGVIGDDGLGGIRLGQGNAEGEGFLAVQRWLRKLRERGVILAVCSKNTDSVAREVFLKHPEMVLKLEDISCFVANWNDKAANIRAIAQELNIGLQSLVFLDDNPAERAIIRRMLPEVAVPEVSGDPTDFIDAVERNRYFELVMLGKEDLRRAQYYQANAERRQIESSSDGIAEFLQSLQMTAEVGPISDLTLERSTQLINKSNQFNLTTIRRSTAEVLALSRDPQWITRTVSLKDRFGDNGLISVLLGKMNGDCIEIDTWLMSCRVLKRNVEQLLLNEICRVALDRGFRRIGGRYIPTAKNALVENHYSGLGFKLIERSDDGQCEYELDLASFAPVETFIQVAHTA